MTTATGHFGLITDISPRDQMYIADPDNYSYWGQAALGAIDLALKSARKDNVHSALDIPCGHGRVLRFLRAAFPEAVLAGCDTDADAVEFCVATFDAVPVHVGDRVELVDLPGDFDLIWSGSLFTHLASDRWVWFLRKLAANLSVGGVLVFATQGRVFRDRLRQGELDLGIGGRARQVLVADADAFGFGYQPYPNSDDYGVCIATPRWIAEQVEKLPGMRLISYAERGWGGLQDVVACTRDQ